MQDEPGSKAPVEGTPAAVTGTAGEHTHRWRIEAQGGPESAGSCACGQKRQFANSYTSEQTNTYRRGPRRR